MARPLRAVPLPMRDGAPIDMSDLLAEFEEHNEVHEPPQVCDISGHPLTVEAVAQPAEAGVTPDSATGLGGHPDSPTSELLEDAADRLNRVANRIWGGDAPISGFIAELRDRAAAFAAFGD